MPSAWLQQRDLVRGGVDAASAGSSAVRMDAPRM